MFSFPEACRGGANRYWGGDLESSVFLPNDLADMFLMGSLFGSRGGWGVEGVASFSYTVIVVEEG